MPQPPADVTIDEALVRSLLHAEHPDLAALPLVPGPEGWDNAMWRLGDDLAVRVPRRAEGGRLISNEQRWLPVLAPLLPLPVPVPLRTGGPVGDYPWSWSIVPWLEGEPGDAAPLTHDPETLATSLRALHVPAHPDVKVHPYGRGRSLAAMPDPLTEHFARVLVDDRQAFAKVWRAGVEADEWPGPPVWLHADLHPANTLTRDGSLAALIDWGDLCQGDPAVDLAAAWLNLPDAPSVRTCLDAYEADGPLRTRARAWAARFALLILEVGLHEGPGAKPTWAAPGRRALALALT